MSAPRWIAMAALAAALLATAACDRARASGGRGRAGAPRRVQVATGELAPRVLLTGALRATAAVELTTPRTDTWQLSIRWMAEDGASVVVVARPTRTETVTVLRRGEVKPPQCLVFHLATGAVE